ncbi:uncharacterized protein LOC124887773 [Capsicum annuum]|uniref:uncharacterized protein LOC124887773 n=1 Tax=Capsicum annuum TaxID=4072 RepID=UPI001FB1186E|nr:uncharacterized protein LOC124887773 [Capsicum annuum]
MRIVNGCWKHLDIKKTDVFIIRRFNPEHSCRLSDRILKNIMATTAFVCEFAAPKLVNYKRKYTSRDIMEEIKVVYGVNINYMKSWCTKERAIAMLRGSPADGPVVVVDGVRLSGPYQGTFLSASTLDGAGCILPLAYGIVDMENDSSWSWFFNQFKAAFEKCDNIYFRKSKKSISDLYYSMAKAYRKEDFDYLISKIEKNDSRVKKYLQEAGYEKLSRCHSPINRGRMMTSNIAECINGCLVEARKLPIYEFLEEVRILFGSWNYKNSEIASYTSTTLGHRFDEILTLNGMKALRMTVKASSPYIYSVYESGRRYIIDLESESCNCERFQIEQIPCAHTIAILKSKHVKEFGPYCSEYYKLATLVKTYEVPIIPMPDRTDWNVPNSVAEEEVLPSIFKRLPGRSKKGRKKKSCKTLSSSIKYCGRYGHEGYNRRSCNFFPK